MANLLPPHQSSEDEGGRESYILPAQVQDVPLLPYERALIAHMGITVEEYAWFKERARQTQLEYAANPPRVVAGGIGEAIIVSLVVGALFTAASVALAPKPREVKQPKQQKQIQQKNVAGLQGSTKYNQTYGFESVADLASYGEPIPYLHGKYRPENDYKLIRWPIEIWGNAEFDERDLESNAWPTTSGGIVINGQVVWSKVYSWGAQQSLKIAMLMGCGGLEKEPDAEGIFLGNTTLDSLSPEQYAFYWETEDERPRLKKRNLLYGTAGGRDTGDPDNRSSISDKEAFFCSTRARNDDKGFSMSYTPTSQTTFGVFAPIPNGQDRRINWRVISRPEQTEGDARARIKEEREKNNGESNKQRGVGVGYQRFMALTEFDGDKGDKKRKSKVIKVGEKGEYNILKRDYGDKFEKGVDVDDINNQSFDERQQVDSQLQTSDIYMCGSCVLQIYDRDKEKWVPPEIDGTDGCDVSEQKQVEIWAKMKAIEVRRDRRIGIVPRNIIEGKTKGDFRDEYANNGRNLTRDNHVPTEWFGLVKAQFGIVRNQRPCEVTEIGLKSNVWGQFTGLCNFNEVPTADDLEEADEDNINYNVGNMNIYFPRYSFFMILVREADDSKNYKAEDDKGNKGNWRDLGLTIGVRGIKPVDQYNYIRFKHPKKAAYEFRFFPLTGAYIWNNFSVQGKSIPILDASDEKRSVSEACKTDLGTFQVEFPGRDYKACGIAQSPLMLGKEGKKEGEGGGGGGGGDNDGGGGGGGGDDEKCETRYKEKSSGRPGSGNLPKIEDGVVQRRTAAGPGASARVTEQWVWKGKTIKSISKTGSNVGRPIEDEVKKDGKTYKVGKSKIKDGGNTSGFFTWEIERCEKGRSALSMGADLDNLTDQQLQAEINALTGECISCGSDFVSNSTLDYREALEPETLEEYHYEEPFPQEIQEPEAPLGWQLDKATEDITGEPEAVTIDEAVLEIVGPDGKVKSSHILQGTYGGPRSIKPCLDESTGNKDFEFEKYIDVKSPKGKGQYVLCKNDKVQIKPLKTTNCSGPYLEYELWVVPEGYSSGGDPNTLGARARSCKEIWNSNKKKRVDLKKGETPTMDWRPNSGEYRKGQQKNYSATIRAKCKGTKVGGYILGESFNICLSPEDFCTGGDCGVCDVRWSKCPDKEYKREEKVNVQVTFRNIKTRIRGDWYVNGKKENTDFEGQKGMKCDGKEYPMNFQFRMPSKYKSNLELKFKWQEEDPVGGFRCCGESVKVMRVVNSPDGKSDCSIDNDKSCNSGGGGTPDSDSDPENLSSCCDYKGRWNNWEVATQIVEHSHYDGLIQRSSDSGPEHTIVYVNESMSQDPIPGYELTTTAGLSIRANQQVNALDSVRCWVQDGKRIQRIRKSSGNTGGLDDDLKFTDNPGQSDNFADLVWYLLTSNKFGVGDLVKESMVDAQQMRRTARYLQRYGLLFNGAIDQKVNVRDYIAELAPFFLCHFTIRNGLFSLIPVFPTDAQGEILDQAPLAATFDDYNIIEGSLKANYLDGDERQLFHAEVKYRVNPKNTLPEERTVLIKFKNSKNYDAKPIEVFDMTSFCTTREHAVLAGRYFMALRKNITHALTFKTNPEEMRGIGPGDYIRVRTDALPDKKLSVGSIGYDLEVMMVDGDTLEDGTHKILWWKSNQEDLQNLEVEVKNGRIVGDEYEYLAGALFSNTPMSTLPQGETYMIEQVELDEDGLVEVICSNWPEFTTSGRNLRLTGGDVAPGDSVVTFEVWGKPSEDGQNLFAPCREGITYYDYQGCNNNFFEPTGLVRDDGTCYPNCFQMGGQTPYDGFGLNLYENTSSTITENYYNGVVYWRYNGPFPYQHQRLPGATKLGNNSETELQIVTTAEYGYAYNAYYKDLALRPADKFGTALPITGVEILEYTPPAKSYLAERKGTEVRYWLGGQIINRLCFIGVAPDDLSFLDEPDIISGGDDPFMLNPDEGIDPKSALVDISNLDGKKPTPRGDSLEDFDPPVWNGDGFNTTDGDQWGFYDRYAAYAHTSNRFIFDEGSTDLTNGGRGVRVRPYGRIDDGTYDIAFEDVEIYDLTTGDIIWQGSEFVKVRPFLDNYISSSSQSKWNYRYGDCPAKYDGYNHVMATNGSFLDDDATDFFYPWLGSRTIDVLNNQAIRSWELSAMTHSCQPNYLNNVIFARSRVPGLFQRKGKNLLGTSSEYADAIDGFNTCAVGTVWDFGFTPWWHGWKHTMAYNNNDYNQIRNIESGYASDYSFVGYRYGTGYRTNLWHYRWTGWAKGGVNSRMEIGKLIESYPGGSESDPDAYGRTGFYALNLKGAVPPIRCWGIYNARYYWDYRGGSGALRVDGMFTGATVDRGEIKVYYEGDVIYESIAAIYFNVENRERNIYHYAAQDNKWDTDSRMFDANRRVEMRLAGAESTRFYWDAVRPQQATKWNYNYSIPLSTYAEEDEKNRGGIYRTIYGDITLHEWFTVMPENQDIKPYKLGISGRLTDLKGGDKWSINTLPIGSSELTDDHDYRSYLTVYGGIRFTAPAYWRWKDPLPGLEYKLDELNEFGDMWPLPRNCPFWPNTEDEYTNTNYNLLLNNRENPYVGGNGFYSFLGHGELPSYFTSTIQIQHEHTRPKPPDFYAVLGFKRVPFGWNLNTEYKAKLPFTPFDHGYGYNPAYPRFEPWLTSRGFDFSDTYKRTYYYSDGREPRDAFSRIVPDDYVKWTGNSYGERRVERGLGTQVQTYGEPPRSLMWPEAPQSIEELLSYNNFTETEEPEGSPTTIDDRFAIDPDAGETDGYTRYEPYWRKYWKKEQLIYKRVNFEYPGKGYVGDYNSDSPELRAPYLNQPGVGYELMTIQPTIYWEDRFEDSVDPDYDSTGKPVWRATTTGHDKLDNPVLPDIVIEDPQSQYGNPIENQLIQDNDDATAYYQTLLDKEGYQQEQGYFRQKSWGYEMTELERMKLHIYEAGWTGDAQTPPMTGVWVQGTEDIGSSSGYEDREIAPRVSVSFFLGGRLIWEIADYDPTRGFVDGWFPATNYHPDIDALQKTVGNTMGGIIPAGLEEFVEDETEIEPQAGANPNGGGWDLKRKVGSIYGLTEALRNYPPQAMVMDWDATTPSYKSLSGQLFSDYECRFSPGIYKDATPWFNGREWSHEGEINGNEPRWEILNDPARTAGRNGSYGLILQGAIMPRNHWYEDAVEHYNMTGDPSDSGLFSGVIIRNKVMQMFYQGERVYVGAMKVYRNQDMYRVEDLDLPRDEWFHTYKRWADVISIRDPMYPQFKKPARPDETEYQFAKIELTIAGKRRVFGVGRLVDFLQGDSLGTKHLTLSADGEIASANGSSHYSMNNAVKGSADMRTIWVNSGPGRDFAGYWTLHEYRTTDRMEGPGWDDQWYDTQVEKYRENVETWVQYPATLPGEMPTNPDGTPVGDPFDERYPPQGFDYSQHKSWINTLSLEEPEQRLKQRELKRHTRDREEVYKELDPRLVEGTHPDAYDFDAPCKGCTPNPEDL